MEKNSTLFTPASDGVSVPVETKMNDIAENARTPYLEIAREYGATIQRICQFARAAFSDASLAGMPVIVLN